MIRNRLSLFRSRSYRIAQLEEEVETLEAQRDVKKAYVKAATVAMEATQTDLDRVKELFAKGTLGKPELDRAKFDVEAAKRNSRFASRR